MLAFVTALMHTFIKVYLRNKYAPLMCSVKFPSVENTDGSKINLGSGVRIYLEELSDLKKKIAIGPDSQTMIKALRLSYFSKTSKMLTLCKKLQNKGC